MTYKETGNNIEKNQAPALPHTLMQYDVLFVIFKYLSLYLTGSSSSHDAVHLSKL